MHRTSRLAAVVSGLCLSAAVSCAPTSETPSVTFGSNEPVGPWQSMPRAIAGDAAPPRDVPNTAGSGSRAEVAGERAPSVVDGGVTPPHTSAGSSAPYAADGGNAAPPTSRAQAGAGSPAAGSGGEQAPIVQQQADVTSLTFEVTTSPAGGRYQPKNIGAIWIDDSAGKLIKTLQVWAGSRRRYLTGYLGALAGSAIDVTTSATLPRHQTHTVSWDLKDRNRLAVTPGMYRVHMELTDGDQTGRSNSVVFDASLGPTTVMPADAPSFSAMKLVLQ